MEKEIQKTTTDIPAVSFSEFQPTDYETWKAAAIEALKGAPFEKKLFTKTYENITLEPIYTMENVADLAHTQAYPGAADFLRGTKATGYIAQPWTIAQGVDAVNPADFNQILQGELAKGNKAVHLLLDSASKQCVDFDEQSDDRGLSLYTVQDLAAALKDVDLAANDLQVFAGASAVPFLGLLTANCSAVEEIKGCVGADPIGVLAGDGKLPCSLDQLLDEMAGAIKHAENKMPGVKTIFIQGSVYHNGGANAVQEVAYSMATAIAYMDALLDRGLEINQIAGQIRFSFSMGSNFFMEIAKLRAVKLVWAQIVQAYGGDAAAQKIDIFARTSGFTKTVYDPYVNILRTTTEAFSGVVGGVNAMEVAPFDEAIGASDEHSRRIARNTQIMLQTEFDLLQPMDPAGGSWYIESLTQEVAKETWGIIQKVAAEGGVVASLQAGTMQAEINKVLQERFKNIAFRADRVVGTNMYANTIEKPMNKDLPGFKGQKAARKADLAAQDQQMNPEAVSKIDGIACVVAGAAAALAEGACTICVRAKLNKGQSPVVTPIAAHRWTEEFEVLRQKTEAFEAKTGENVNIFLANLGPVPKHKPRADFSTGFFEVAKFNILNNDGFATPEEAAKAAIDSKADVAVICGTDDIYPETVPVLAKAIKAACPNMMVVLAGAPAKDCKPAYDEAGVEEYIHVKANSFDILTKIQKARGIC